MTMTCAKMVVQIVRKRWWVASRVLFCLALLLVSLTVPPLVMDLCGLWH